MKYVYARYIDIYEQKQKLSKMKSKILKSFTLLLLTLCQYQYKYFVRFLNLCTYKFTSGFEMFSYIYIPIPISPLLSFDRKQKKSLKDMHCVAHQKNVIKCFKIG